MNLDFIKEVEEMQESLLKANNPDTPSFVYNNGGRIDAGYKGTTGDCVCRAISIATETPYQEVYDLINKYGKQERLSKRRKSKSSARTGVHKDTIRKIMLEHFGWKWKPTMLVGKGCQVHLKADELPKGRLVVSVSKHSVAVIDGVIHDTYDCSRGGTRCVYGYYYNDKQDSNPKKVAVVAVNPKVQKALKVALKYTKS
jgi:hypothetical protein